ncbi:LD-carboxypeptidase [Sphingomonas sp. SFZ2018-12]|uniref:LD-carboxypeptidase n=1 Tax=Sphingomonas sp. SFZ2018-12 TaxID=2683197 RepID=UPI001F10E1B6|nr:LD-carboxypeptidase [Sphingomonas sp. SFZ2018-12]
MRIGVVAPARPIEEVVASRVKALGALIHPDVGIDFHPQCFASDGHFAGADGTRAAAFLEFANDSGFDAIWFARGGYGSNRILASVMPQLSAAARHKTYLGYSDMGFLLAALYARRIGQPVHGPMTADINRDDQGACAARALGWLVRRDRAALEPSVADRPVAAFNLSILAALIGTQWLPDLADHVLMVEEVGEPLYRIDRMLFQMANATQLKGLAGVRLGTVNDVQANDPPWGEALEAMITRWCGDLGVPYLGRAEIGHAASNRVVPFGLV